MEQMEWQEKLRALSAGELTPDEQNELLQEATSSAEKNAELRFSQGLTQVLKERDLFEVKGMIAGILLEEGLPDARQPQSKPGKSWWSWKWSLLLTLGLSVGVFWVGSSNGWWQQEHPRVLATRYLQPLENLVFVDDTEQASVETLGQGMSAYDRQDYTNAIRYLQTYYQQTQDGNAGLFLAVSYLMKDQAKVAIPILLDGLQRTGPVAEVSRWYLALAYLQREDVAAAIGVLEGISSNGMYSTEAQALLKELQ